MQDLNTFFFAQGKSKLPFNWTGTINLSRLNPLPTRYRPSSGRGKSRQRERSRYDNAQEGSITALQTSFNPLRTIAALRSHRWTLWDLQYLVLIGFSAFSLSISPLGILYKTAMVTVMTVLLLLPVTKQFFLPAYPIIAYLLYFFCSRYIPVEYRPHIWVQVLPAMENVMYGTNLSNILSAHTNAVLDILAWVPYGLGHFGAPAVCSLVMFVFAAPGTTPVFARTFGWLNLLGVTLQLVFPCTPPWYEARYGLEVQAYYGMEGSPAGLARVDALLGVDMYTTSFTTAPLPFGAFPSLHAADATLEALFMSYCFPQLKGVFALYTAWIWWATMYLNHHYAVDLVGGGILAAAAYYIVRSRWLPRRQLGKLWRWAYEYVEIGNSEQEQQQQYRDVRRRKLADEEAAFDDESWWLDLDNEEGELERFQHRRRDTAESDEWAVGSSSSSYRSGGSGSGSGGSSSAGSTGSLSPTFPNSHFSDMRDGGSTDDDYHRSAFVVGITPHGNLWNGETLSGRQSEVSDVVVMR